MVALTLLSRPGCHLCDEMKALVERVRSEVAQPIALRVIDIGTDPELESKYGLEIPVLLIDGRKVAKYRVRESELRRMLNGGVGPARNDA